MKIGIFLLKQAIRENDRYIALCEQLQSASYELYEIASKADIRPQTDLVLSIGGDGTFLSAAQTVADVGIPILGVNFGRLGFLSENSPEAVLPALLQGEPYAVNEVSIHRIGVGVLGIQVSIDGEALPTYWADGLLVATSSGSTAYSLSVGGPICMPDTKVLIIAPICPHNLNVRPLVVPDTSHISISIKSRDPKVTMTMDNQTVEIDCDWTLEVAMAQFSLKRIRLAKSEFVSALTSRLFWGEDKRNI